MDSQWMLNQLNWRYAVKKFDPTKKISESDWKFLSEVLRLSPSSYGTQPWKFLLIQTPELREKLRPATWNQSQVTESSHYVVFTSLRKMTETYADKYIARMAQVRNVTVESLAPFRKVLIGDLVNGPRSQQISAWSQRQGYIAMGNLMNAAAFMKIDTCPIEGLEPHKYDEILGLDQTEYTTVAAVAIGYRHADDKYQNIPKVRFEMKDILEVR